MVKVPKSCSVTCNRSGSVHTNDRDRKIRSIRQRLEELQAEKLRLQAKLVQLEACANEKTRKTTTTKSNLSAQEKVALFQNLFVGRKDCHAIRWENNSGKSGYAVACHNEWQPSLCQKPRVKCSECPNKAHKALDAGVIYDHLLGRQTVGLYPLMPDDTCKLLAVDLDKSDWQQATYALARVCNELHIPYAVERSRSGMGAHLWIFFTSKVPAKDARRLGFGLLDRAMENYPSLSFDSYDRLFPNQDAMPDGGFGNLIALPLQRQPRQADNSVFIDRDLVPYPDQWQFLEGLEQLAPERLQSLLETLNSAASQLQFKPWEQGLPIEHTKLRDCPSRIKVVLANQIYVSTTRLPSALLARLKRLASFANPVFFKTQAMRFSTHGIPRYISLARIEQDYLIVPRGCLDAVCQLLSEQDIAIDIQDEREVGEWLSDIQFTGVLRGDQKLAVRKILVHDTGILHAPTAFGKTVAAIAVITERKVNTLILTHTRQLVDQWRERLSCFVDAVEIGTITGGKRHPCGSIDIATYQSLLSRKDNNIDPLLLNYGQVIIDECHHISAPNYDRLLSEVRSRYVFGLTATPERQDGHQPIIYMQAGPVRYRVKNDRQSRFEQHVIVRLVEDKPPEPLVLEEKPHIAEVYRWLMESDRRNELLVQDVMAQVVAGSNPLLLTERREHAAILNKILTEKGIETVVLRGSMGASERDQAMNAIQTAQILIATGKYIGEGFDLPRLDTLFLALPISWKGSLVQYAGRIHREAESKTKVTVYDYVDAAMPMLLRMFQRRCKGYKAMGYRLIHNNDTLVTQTKLKV